MGSSCCGGGCCGSSHGGEKKPTRPSSRAPGFLAAALLLGIAAMSAIALTRQPATAPAPTKPPAPAAPAAQPAAPAAQPNTKPDIAIEGVIRHGIPTPIARPSGGGTVRVATYNVENLFDAPPEGKSLPSGTEPKPADHKKAAAAAIKAIDADILAVQEIESLETLTHFRDEYLKGLGYDHIASVDAGDDRGIEQAVLSRYPILGVKNWVHLPIGGTHPQNRTGNDRTAGGEIQFKRSPLMVTIDVPPAKDAPQGAKPYRLTLFSVHFKSGSKDGYWREREAIKTAALARELESADHAANVIILGDFNARPQEKPTRAVLDAGFIDAFGDLPDGEPKYITHSSDRVIDHIMLNPNAAAELVKDTRFVLGTLNRPAGVDWRTTPTPPGYAADHYPVVIDLYTTDHPVPAAAPVPATETDRPSPAGAAPSVPPK